MALSLPEALAKLPRHPLLYSHPSPIHPLPALTSYLNTNTNTNPPKSTKSTPQIRLFAKREDQSSPLACSGNKYRKLEYIVPDILSPQPLYNSYPNNTPNPNHPTPSQKTTTLVTEGAIQSNHTIQVSSLANHLNLSSVALLHKGTGGGLSASTDKPSFLRTGNPQIAHLLGADIRVLEAGSTNGGKIDTVEPVLAELRAAGKTPYWIPSGASLHPLGGVGYARCAFEIAAQEKELGARFDYIFVACGSGSTVGGLIAGFKMLERMESSSSSTSTSPSQNTGGKTNPPRKVIGIINSPTKPQTWHEERVLRFARQAGSLIGLEDASQAITLEADVHLDGRFAGAAYGVLDEDTKRTMEIAARREALILDPVYTGKVLRGVMGWVEGGGLVGDWEGGGPLNALFIHTGGQAALAAYADIE
ncbi:tryptophan synthase beta subunit-like PLP-dependent enzyme [Aspergillus campestris IBT 28561]|uniref:Tryptophan synthase beta subunit-like PLP-dependent enzyme n=1 Tax=Aspergillus campestris (strain IBT 28561) TaxID=1392248 RepID=A0A2I1D1Y9_ASPC2|nr:tryptophan synthase beta subunit-like PLP-dependent enzyme [Aspergillus campestris IBT 28561]PKY03885.1 tryptophan synthase beta subunit-like PLP-dependent enzyme [Aspergillus campestris IBT 28561]